MRRLAGVTQVVAAGEGHIFHNRLTHTLEVAQISRRLAEHLNREQSELAQTLGIDPEVAEAAALAHDLGHPPFGHVAEESLDDAMKKRHHADGFEGNPQSFRVVTKLSRRHTEFEGLNLTRASLNAILKYPWYRQTEGWRERKWGAYHEEEADFIFAREGLVDDWKSAEAEVMDWADDIAYAVHDVEDFYRGGLIPLDRLLGPDSDAEAEDFCTRVFDRWETERVTISHDRDELREAFATVIDLMRHPALSRPYEGSLEQRSVLRSMTSTLIGVFIKGLSLRDPEPGDARRADRNPEHDRQLRMLKELTWIYVIRNPALATQQAGQKRIVVGLFELFADAAQSNRALLPISARERLEKLEASSGEASRHYARIAADIVSGLTEDQASKLYARVTGVNLGSLFEPLA